MKYGIRYSLNRFEPKSAMLLLTCACLLGVKPSQAQAPSSAQEQQNQDQKNQEQTNQDQKSGDKGYQVGENKSTTALPTPPADSNTPPSPTASHQLARIDYISGKVTWRANDNEAWSKATANQSVREGMQVWVSEGGRAEIRFDDGSLLRLGKDAVVTIQTLYRDDQGAFTQIKMVSGLAMLLPKSEHSVYQVDTPFLSVKANGRARVRLGVGDNVEIGVRQGHATIEGLQGSQGKTTLAAGDFVSLRDAQAAYTLRDLPAPDSWDRWNDERDHLLATGGHPVYGSPPVVVRPAFGFLFNIPLGGYSHYHGYDRDARRHRR